MNIHRGVQLIYKRHGVEMLLRTKVAFGINSKAVVCIIDYH